MDAHHLKVGIAMPTFNRREDLPKAIDSIVAQTHTNWILAVVNDHGCDVSDLIRMRNDSRIHLIDLESNTNDLGNTPRNVALDFLEKQDAGAFAYLDDDNEWYPDHLERCLQLLKESPELHFVLASSEIYMKTSKRYVTTRSTTKIAPTLVDTSEIVHKKNGLRWHAPMYCVDYVFVAQMINAGYPWQRVGKPTVRYYVDEKRMTKMLSLIDENDLRNNFQWWIKEIAGHR